MKKYLLILLAGACFHNLYAQTSIKAGIPEPGKTQDENLWSFTSAKRPALFDINMQYAFFNTAAFKDGCVFCALNLTRRVPGEQVTVYKAKCEINFLPGFESAANDNWVAYIDPNAILCEPADCTDPVNAGKFPAIVKKSNNKTYRASSACYIHKAGLYYRNYFTQTGIRDLAGLYGYRRQNRISGL
jgi:hypothetical protein